MDNLILTIEEIINRIDDSVGSFIHSDDKWLLENNLNERAICNSIASHMRLKFKNYDIDCEYNFNVTDPKKRKRCFFISDIRNGSDLANDAKVKINNGKLRCVVPDIIVHKRGLATNNLCIMEVKKASNPSLYDRDLSKLSKYTSKLELGGLNYTLGVFMEISTIDPVYFSLRFFSNGYEMPYLSRQINSTS